MGHDDDFDEMPLPDEEAEDFRSFDPESYLRKRGRATGVSPSDDQRSEQADFDNFDADAYLRKRRAERKQQPLETATYRTGEDVPPPRGRRRRSVLDENDPVPDVGAAAGLGAGIFSLFGSREATRLNVEILRNANPWVKTALLILGCAILAVLGAICALGFLLATALARR
jgi:hypothetical protein